MIKYVTITEDVISSASTITIVATVGLAIIVIALAFYGVHRYLNG